MDSAIICFVPADVALDMEKAKLSGQSKKQLGSRTSKYDAVSK